MPNCSCYACITHHRAYITHLLSAKEMLGWTLLQIHNHHVLDRFFAGVRASLARQTFDADSAAFATWYELELPVGAGSGPRVRGYQFRSDGKEEGRKNAVAFRKLGEDGEEVKMVDDKDAPGLDTGVQQAEDAEMGGVCGQT